MFVVCCVCCLLVIACCIALDVVGCSLCVMCCSLCDLCCLLFVGRVVLLLLCSLLPWYIEGCLLCVARCFGLCVLVVVCLLLFSDCCVLFVGCRCLFVHGLLFWCLSFVVRCPTCINCSLFCAVLGLLRVVCFGGCFCCVLVVACWSLVALS